MKANLWTHPKTQQKRVYLNGLPRLNSDIKVYLKRSDSPTNFRGFDVSYYNPFWSKQNSADVDYIEEKMEEYFGIEANWDDVLKLVAGGGIEIAELNEYVQEDNQYSAPSESEMRDWMM